MKKKISTKVYNIRLAYTYASKAFNLRSFKVFLFTCIKTENSCE